MYWQISCAIGFGCPWCDLLSLMRLSTFEAVPIGDVTLHRLMWLKPTARTTKIHGSYQNSVPCHGLSSGSSMKYPKHASICHWMQAMQQFNVSSCIHQISAGSSSPKTEMCIYIYRCHYITFLCLPLFTISMCTPIVRTYIYIYIYMYTYTYMYMYLYMYMYMGVCL